MASPKGYLLDENAARWVQRHASLSSPGASGAGDVRQFSESPLGRVYVRNLSAETVPAHGIMRVTGYTVAPDGKVIVNVNKPSNSLGKFLVNGPVEIPNAAIGIGLDTSPVIVAYESMASFSSSSNYGVNGWKLDRITPGQPLLNVEVLADVDPVNRYCLANLMQLQRVLFQGTVPGRVGAILGGAGCTIVTLKTINDELVLSSVGIKVYNWTTKTICLNGDKYGAAILIDGNWLAIAEDCNDDGPSLPPVTKQSAFATVGDPVVLPVSAATVYSELPSVSYTLGTGVGGT